MPIELGIRHVVRSTLGSGLVQPVSLNMRASRRRSPLVPTAVPDAEVASRLGHPDQASEATGLGGDAAIRRTGSSAQPPGDAQQNNKRQRDSQPGESVTSTSASEAESHSSQTASIGAVPSAHRPSYHCSLAS
jgi:hypothetical protein